MPVLEKCEVCGRDISSDAKVCLGCGAKEPFANKKAVGIVVLFVLIIIYSVFSKCLGK